MKPRSAGRLRKSRVSDRIMPPPMAPRLQKVPRRQLVEQHAHQGRQQGGTQTTRSRGAPWRGPTGAGTSR